MGAFTLTVPTGGIMEKVDATHARVKIMGTHDKDISGVTVYVKYTKGPETSITLSAGVLNVAVDTTNVHGIPKLNYGTYEQLAQTYTGSSTQYFTWPVAVPCDADAYFYITVSSTGSAMDSTTTVLLTARRDTVGGK